MEAISNAGSCVGVLSKEGVVLGAEKRVTSKLLDTQAVGVKREKLYVLADHVVCAVAGITSDANILVNKCRLSAQQYLFAYDEPMPVEQLVRSVCDAKQGYTQFGGLRPFGVSLLYAGWDASRGFQLLQSDPSGNYGAWKATSVGANHQAAANALASDYDEDLSLEDAIKLVAKVLGKTVDSSALTPDKVELVTVSRDPETGDVVHHIYEPEDLKPVLDAVNAQARSDAEGGNERA